MQDAQPILPDPYSERFGLRADPIKAAEHAHYFMSWAPPYCDAPEHIKKYMMCKIGIAGVGYMYLTENNILRKGDGTDSVSGTEYLICFFEDEYSEIV